jgi:hypothetical protein
VEVHISDASRSDFQVLHTSAERLAAVVIVRYLREGVTTEYRRYMIQKGPSQGGDRVVALATIAEIQFFADGDQLTKVKARALRAP